MTRPKFKKDFDIGWIGFVHADNLLSRGIAYLTRREKKGNTTVSHSFIVTGPDECIEANLPAGVVLTRLSKEYFGRKRRRVYFRKPKAMTEKMGERIAKRARAQLGAKFDFGVFTASALKNSFLGHLIDKVFHGKPGKKVAQFLDKNGQWVCSELVAFCLQKEARYRDKGVLSRPPGTIDPQQLFEDEELFEDPQMQT